MSVVLTRNDADWLTTVPLKDMPSRSFGQPAGLFYVGLSDTGDASGGLVSLNAQLTAPKKQEFFYEFQGLSIFTDSILSDGDLVELTINSGPRIPDFGSGNFNNISFRETEVGVGVAITDNTIWEIKLGTPEKPMVVYGDVNIAGNFSMINVVWQINDLAVEYFIFGWGFYYRYQTLFRGLPVGTA